MVELNGVDGQTLLLVGRGAPGRTGEGGRGPAEPSAQRGLQRQRVVHSPRSPPVRLRKVTARRCGLEARTPRRAALGHFTDAAGPDAGAALFAPATWLADGCFAPAASICCWPMRGHRLDGPRSGGASGGPGQPRRRGAARSRALANPAALERAAPGLRQACCLKDELVLELHPGLRAAFTVTRPRMPRRSGSGRRAGSTAWARPGTPCSSAVRCRSPARVQPAVHPGPAGTCAACSTCSCSTPRRACRHRSAGQLSLSVRSGPDAAQAATLTLETLEVRCSYRHRPMDRRLPALSRSGPRGRRP